MPEETADKIDAVVDTAETIAPVIVATATAINPVLGGVMGLIAGIIGTGFSLWRKWRTPLIQSRDAYDKLAMGARAAGDVIEKLVKPTAELWERAKPTLKQAEKDGATMPHKI